MRFTAARVVRTVWYMDPGPVAAMPTLDAPSTLGLGGAAGSGRHALSECVPPYNTGTLITG